jgi:hypothetical protein
MTTAVPKKPFLNRVYFSLISGCGNSAKHYCRNRLSNDNTG